MSTELLGCSPQEVLEALSNKRWRESLRWDIVDAARFVEEYLRVNGRELDIPAIFGKSASAVENKLLRRIEMPDQYASLKSALRIDDPDYLKAVEEELLHAVSESRLDEKLFPKASQVSPRVAAKAVWPGFVAYFILAVEAPGILIEYNEATARPPKMDVSPKSYAAYNDFLNTYILYFHPEGQRYDAELAQTKGTPLDADIAEQVYRAHFGKRVFSLQIRKVLERIRDYLLVKRLATAKFKQYVLDWKKKNWQGILDDIPTDADIRPYFEQLVEKNPVPTDGVTMQQKPGGKDKDAAANFAGYKAGEPVKVVDLKSTLSGMTADKLETPMGVNAVLHVEDQKHTVIGAFDTDTGTVIVTRDFKGHLVLHYDAELRLALKNKEAAVLQGHKDMPGTVYNKVVELTPEQEEVMDFLLDMYGDEAYIGSLVEVDLASTEFSAALYAEFNVGATSKLKLKHVASGTIYTLETAFVDGEGDILIVYRDDEDDLLADDDPVLTGAVNAGKMEPTGDSNDPKAFTNLTTQQGKASTAELQYLPALLNLHAGSEPGDFKPVSVAATLAAKSAKQANWAEFKEGTTFLHKTTGLNYAILGAVSYKGVIRFALRLTGPGASSTVALSDATVADAVAEGLYVHGVETKPDPTFEAESWVKYGSDLYFVCGFDVEKDAYYAQKTELALFQQPKIETVSRENFEKNGKKQPAPSSVVDLVGAFNVVGNVKDIPAQTAPYPGGTVALGNGVLALFVGLYHDQTDDVRTGLAMRRRTQQHNFVDIVAWDFLTFPVDKFHGAVQSSYDPPEKGESPPRPEHPSLNYYLSDEAIALAKKHELTYVSAPKDAEFHVGTPIKRQRQYGPSPDLDYPRVILGWVAKKHPHADEMLLFAVLGPRPGSEFAYKRNTALKQYEISYVYGTVISEDLATYGKDDTGFLTAAQWPAGGPQVILPSNLPVDWDAAQPIKQPAWPDMPEGHHAAAGVIALVPGGSQHTIPGHGTKTMSNPLVLTVRPVGMFKGYKITFPKGGIDKNESIEKAAIREVKEESGLAVKIVDYLGDFSTDESMTRYFIGYVTAGDPKQTDKETDAVSLMPFTHGDKAPWESVLKPRDVKVLAAAKAWAAENGAPTLFTVNTAEQESLVTFEKDAVTGVPEEIEGDAMYFVSPMGAVDYPMSALRGKAISKQMHAENLLSTHTDDEWHFASSAAFSSVGYPSVGAKLEKPWAVTVIAYVRVYSKVNGDVAHYIILGDGKGNILIEMLFGHDETDLPVWSSDFNLADPGNAVYMSPSKFKIDTSAKSEFANAAPPPDPLAALEYMAGHGVNLTVIGAVREQLTTYNKPLSDLWKLHVVESSAEMQLLGTQEGGSWYADEGAHFDYKPGTAKTSFQTHAEGRYVFMATAAVTVRTGMGHEYVLVFVVASPKSPAATSQYVALVAKDTTGGQAHTNFRKPREGNPGVAKLQVAAYKAEQAHIQQFLEEAYSYAKSAKNSGASEVTLATVLKMVFKNYGYTLGGIKKHIANAGVKGAGKITFKTLYPVLKLFIDGAATSDEAENAKGLLQAKVKKAGFGWADDVPQSNYSVSLPGEPITVAPLEDPENADTVLFVNDPDPDDLKIVGKVSGGTKPNHLVTTPDGKKWLIKTAGHYDATNFRAATDKAAYQLSSLLKPNNVPVGTVNYNGKDWSIQPMLDGTPITSFGPGDLSDPDMTEILTQHVADMFMGDHDGHAGNWLRLSSGKLKSIDKGQAFKFITPATAQAVSYMPTQSYSPHKNVAKTLLVNWSNGNQELPSTAFAGMRKVIDRVEKLTNEQIAEILSPVAASHKLSESKTAQMVKALQSRRDSFLSDWTAVMKKLAKNRSEMFTWPAVSGVSGAKPAESLKAPTYKKSLDVTPAEMGFTTVEKQVVEDVKEAGWQGKSIHIDADAIENQEVMVRAVKYKSGGVAVDGTFLHWRVNKHAAQKADKVLQTYSGATPTAPVHEGPPPLPFDDITASAGAKKPGVRYFAGISAAIGTLMYHLNQANVINKTGQPDPKASKIEPVVAIFKPELEEIIQTAAKTTAEKIAVQGAPVNTGAVLSMAKQYLSYCKLIEEIWTDVKEKGNESAWVGKEVKVMKPFLWEPDKAEEEETERELSSIPFDVAYQSSGKWPTITPDSETGLSLSYPPMQQVMGGNQFVISDKSDKSLRIYYSAVHGGGGGKAHNGQAWAFVPGGPSPSNIARVMNLFQQVTAVSMSAAKKIDREVIYWSKQAFALQGGDSYIEPTDDEGLHDAEFAKGINLYRAGKAEDALAIFKSKVAEGLGMSVDQAEALAADHLGGAYDARGNGFRRYPRIGVTAGQVRKKFGKKVTVAHANLSGSMLSLWNTMTASNGALLANATRTYYGAPPTMSTGASVGSDFGSGGAVGIFCVFRNVGRAYGGQQGGVFYFDLSLLLRTDVYVIGGGGHETGDQFGNTSSHRFVSLDALRDRKSVSKLTGRISASSSPQLVARHDIDLRQYLLAVTSDDYGAGTASRDKMREMAKNAGWTTFAQGRTIEQVILTPSEAKSL